jgi:hypothetical protein
MKTTGPRGRSSMLLLTGSVVVPATSETRATDWLVKALRILDLPVFRLPTMAIRNRDEVGVSFNPGIASPPQFKKLHNQIINLSFFRNKGPVLLH